MDNKIIAPITLFTYNRLSHTLQTVTALKQNELAERSDLIIYSDGPKNESDAEKIAEVRNYLKSITGFKSITIHESQNNKGLANSIIEGVTEVVEKYGKIIVIEDDLLTSKYFLRYMNDALDYYLENEDVISICGYMYPIKAGDVELCFFRIPDCWGWGTWKRGWSLFERDGKKLLESINKNKLQYEFNLQNSYPFLQMLREQINGKNNSWAIRWYASAFLNNKLSCYNSRSLVENIGNDGSGTHCGETELYKSEVYNESIKLKEMPFIENQYILNEIIQYFKSISNSNILNKVTFYKRISRFLKFFL